MIKGAVHPEKPPPVYTHSHVLLNSRFLLLHFPLRADGLLFGHSFSLFTSSIWLSLMEPLSALSSPVFAIKSSTCPVELRGFSQGLNFSGWLLVTTNRLFLDINQRRFWCLTSFDTAASHSWAHPALHHQWRQFSYWPIHCLLEPKPQRDIKPAICCKESFIVKPCKDGLPAPANAFRSSV